MKINGIKANGKDYDIWATSQEVEALNNQGNAALGKELSSGKQSIVDAINNVGGEASADESLSELAQDIEQMPIVNVSAFKFSEVPNLAKQIAEQTYTAQLGEDFRTKITEINDVNGDITSVSNYAFQNCTNLLKVSLPEVQTIGSNSFYGCTNLENLNLPKCTSVGNNTFMNCANLEIISLPEVINVGNEAFRNCLNLYSINLPKCTSIGSYTFAVPNNTDNILNSIILPEAVTILGNAFFSAIRFCKKIYIPKVTSIGAYAFSTYNDNTKRNCLLEELYLDSMDTHPANVFTYSNNSFIFVSLIILSLKQGFDSDINVCNGQWKASTYLTTSSDQWENHLTLYTNLLEYTLKRLYDHSQDGVTRRIRIGFHATLFADSQLTTEPYGSYYTPLIKAAAQACLDECENRNWIISA